MVGFMFFRGTSQSGFGALGDHLALLFRERGIDVQSELVAVSTQRRDDEMHLVLHQPADEVHVS